MPSLPWLVELCVDVTASRWLGAIVGPAADWRVLGQAGPWSTGPWSQVAVPRSQLPLGWDGLENNALRMYDPLVSTGQRAAPHL